MPLTTSPSLTMPCGAGPAERCAAQPSQTSPAMPCVALPRRSKRYRPSHAVPRCTTRCDATRYLPCLTQRREALPGDASPAQRREAGPCAVVRCLSLPAKRGGAVPCVAGCGHACHANLTGPSGARRCVACRGLPRGSMRRLAMPALRSRAERNRAAPRLAKPAMPMLWLRPPPAFGGGLALFRRDPGALGLLPDRR